MARKEVRWWHWVALVFLAFCLSFLASTLWGCTSDDGKKVASTLEVGGSKGSFDGDGDFLSGDASSVFVSIRPLAALEPPQEVRVVATPPEAPEPVEELTEPLEEPEPHVCPVPEAPKAPWYGDPAFIAAISALVGALGLRGGQRLHQMRKRPNEETA